MKEIKSIIDQYDRLKADEPKMALATVINVEQSSYRRSGARMLIMENGDWIGGISGGCLEGDTLRKAQYAIFKNQPTTVQYDTRDDDPNQIGSGLGCNGLIEVLITPIDTHDPNNPIEVLRQCTLTRKEHIIIHTIQSSDGKEHEGLSFLYDTNTSLPATLTNKKATIEWTKIVDDVLAQKKSTLTQLDSSLFFIEYLAPPIQLYIFGSNYDIVPLLSIANSIGWNTSVIANLSKIKPVVKKHSHQLISHHAPKLSIDDYTAILLMSHDYETDKNNFISLMGESISYLGILGPKKRHEKLKSELDLLGHDYDFSHVYAPMGLDTGAATPEEIAISILSEIRTVFSRRDGGHLRDRQSTIYNS